jgi:hypothetical protein
MKTYIFIGLAVSVFCICWFLGSLDSFHEEKLQATVLSVSHNDHWYNSCDFTYIKTDDGELATLTGVSGTPGDKIVVYRVTGRWDAELNGIHAHSEK